MNIYLGTDLCEVERIKKIHLKYKELFLNKIYTTNEINYCKSKPKGFYESLAARYAVKEAVSKALNSGINGIGWNKGINFKDVELLRSNNGNISIKLEGHAFKIAQNLNITSWAVSISHTDTIANATVIGYSK